MPHACIGVDVIVGFHGETDDRFDETWRFLHEIDASYFHVFTYSERSDTHAMQLDGKVDMGVRRQRNEELRILSDKKKHHFYSQFIDTTRGVLFEKAEDIDGELQLTGHTDNYVKVICPAKKDLSNQIVNVHLQDLKTAQLMAGDIV